MAVDQCSDVQMNTKDLLVPSSKALKKQWVHFIVSGNAPTQFSKVLYGPNISRTTISSTWANTELASMNV